jgi:hypothetical protein
MATAKQTNFVKTAPDALLAKATAEQMSAVFRLALDLKFDGEITEERLTTITLAKFRAEGQAICLEMGRPFSPKYAGKCAVSGAKVQSWNKVRMIRLEGWSKAAMVLDTVVEAMCFRNMPVGCQSVSAWRRADTVELDEIVAGLDSGKAIHALKRNGSGVAEFAVRRVGESCYHNSRGATYSTHKQLARAIKGTAVFALCLR